MAFNPNRSWVVTYNQMWNLSMRDPLPRNHMNQKGFFQFNNTGNNNANRRQSSSGSNHNGQGGKRKSDYCWNFNKGVKCTFGARCKFIERCSFCDSPNHGIHVCPKVEAKDREEKGDKDKNHSATN